MRSLSIVVVFLTFAGPVTLRGERPGTKSANSAGDGSTMLAGTISIATGPDPTVDGYLEIRPDDYGAWAADFVTGAGADLFNPSGPEPARATTFSSGFFLFAAAGTQRELLSDSSDWQDIFPPDASLDRQVLLPLSASDVDPVDGVDDTLFSIFIVTGLDTALGISLRQHVKRVGPGLAKLEQTYTIENASGFPADLVLVRAADLDLVFNGTDFGDDSVGTAWNATGGDRYVIQQEAGDPRTAVTLTSSSATVYYGGKNGIDPDGGGVPYAFGTDVQIWNAYGVPDGSGGADGSDWRNHIAGVGYNTDGFSGASPPGSTDPRDGFIGLEIPLSLEPDEVVEVQIMHWFGPPPPAAACCFPNGSCGDLPARDCAKFGATSQGFGSECASASCSACLADLDRSGEVRVPDLIMLLASWGLCPDPVLAVCTQSTNDCCTASPDLTPGCDNSACCECICACDPFCCGLDPGGGASGAWDSACAGMGAVGDCGASNPNSGCEVECAACVP